MLTAFLVSRGELDTCSNSKATDAGDYRELRKLFILANIRKKKGYKSFSQDPRGSIYMTDAFVELATPLHLRGLDFEQVWASD